MNSLKEELSMPGSVEGIRIQLERISHLLQDSRLAVQAWPNKVF
jgi:hypothetical protein